MAADDGTKKVVEAIVLDIIQPRSPGMGNPPCHLWDIATLEGVAIVIAGRLVKALEDAGYRITALGGDHPAHPAKQIARNGGVCGTSEEVD